MNELTGRELDRAIAVALGWTDLEDAETWIDERDTGYTTFHVWRGQYNGYERDAPAFHTDANAVIAVCAERGWTMIYDAEGAQVIVPCMNPDHEKHYTAYHDDREDVKWQEAGARVVGGAHGRKRGDGVNLTKQHRDAIRMCKHGEDYLRLRLWDIEPETISELIAEGYLAEGKHGELRTTEAGLQARADDSLRWLRREDESGSA